PPSAPLFPYTTLFRSDRSRPEARQERRCGGLEVALTAEHQHEAVAVDADERVARRAPRRAPELGRTHLVERRGDRPGHDQGRPVDRKSTRLNSSHVKI